MATEKKENVPEFNLKKCMSCNMCLEVCPVDCIDLTTPQDSKDPHGYPFVEDESICIGCESCAEDCPVDAIVMVPRKAA